MRLLILIGVLVATIATASPLERTLRLEPGPDNPRNSEGDMVVLQDGRILLIYTRYTEGTGSDHDPAHLAARISEDGGRTWSDDRVVVPNEGGMNVMSVSLLRLADGRIALAYLRKNSIVDCRPLLRFSNDEGDTWSEPVLIIPDSENGYFVMNNDRLVQLESGRLLAPVGHHHRGDEERFDPYATALCYISDDAGQTWRRGEGIDLDEARTGLQEPGVVPLADGRLLMFARTDQGAQFFAHSTDGGESWSAPFRSPLRSPVAPASIKRIAGSDTLLAIWNDNHDPDAGWSQGHRTPLTLATSTDGGATWSESITLEDDPNGWYCYTAITFLEDAALLAYCAGDRRENALGTLQVSRLPLTALHGAE